MTKAQDKARTVFRYILDQRTNLPHLQSWTHDPQRYGSDVNKSWLSSGHTGAGAVSPPFSTADAAKRWGFHNL